METTRTFPHAMLREIFEQPRVINETLSAYADGVCLREEVFLAARQALVGKDSILIAASGSSRHAGLAGEILFEDLAGIAVDVEYASEYIYRSTQTLHNPCFVVISQSGETADTSDALREAIAREAPPSPSPISPIPPWPSSPDARFPPMPVSSVPFLQRKASPPSWRSSLCSRFIPHGFVDA